MLLFALTRSISVALQASGCYPKMFYKPNFCCNCGERIQRAEWKLLSSRRFCDVCGIENQGYEWFPRLVVGIAVVFGIFGLGTVIGSKTANQMSPVQVAQTVGGRPEISRPESKPQPLSNETSEAPTAISSKPADPALAGPTLGVSKLQPPARTSASDEPVYFCGALTKKGKPCSRRVKTKGRCWQHAGQPALEQNRQLDVY